MKVFIKADTVKEAYMQLDLLAPKESGTVAVTKESVGYVAAFKHSPNLDRKPLVIVDSLYDFQVMELVKNSPRLAVSWWLMASYAYYLLDETIISDECFDYLTVLIGENYEEIEHVNKGLVTMDRLSCGSAYDLRIYPNRVMSCATRLVTQLKNHQP